MKTEDQLLHEIGEKTYTWKIAINDGFSTYEYTMEARNDRVSIAMLAKVAEAVLDCSSVSKKYVD